MLCCLFIHTEGKMSEDPVEKESGQDFQSEIECMM